MADKKHFIYLGGYPNTIDMMSSFSNENSTVLQIPHDRYYKNEEIIEHLYQQFISVNRQIDKDTQYIFILHDFGSIYGKFLINKYFYEYNCYVIFLSIGSQISRKYSLYLLYIQWLQLNWLLYLIFPPLANLSHLLFLQYLFYMEKIPRDKRDYFIRNCSMNYLYFNVFEFVDVNEPLHPSIKSIFIRGNSVDALLDKNNTADVIGPFNHWSFFN